MGTDSQINIGAGTLFIKHSDDDTWQELAEIGDVEIECPVEETDTVYIRKIADDSLTFSFTLKLSIRQRIKLFGFWPTIKSLFRRSNHD